MSLYIQKFVDRVRAQELRGARDLIMTINEAKDLQADITRLLLELQNLQSSSMEQKPQNEVITIKLDGGKF
jgi:DNA primase